MRQRSGWLAATAAVAALAGCSPGFDVGPAPTGPPTRTEVGDPVIKVIDGDTIKVRTPGGEVTVRLLAIGGSPPH